MSKKTNFRVLILSIFLLALLSIAAGLYHWARGFPSGVPKYTIARVERGTLTQTIATTGTLNPLVSVEVSSQISGLITEVAVDFNSVVHKGQILARIDAATYEQRLQQAQANLAAAEAAHVLNTLNAARLKGLREADLVSQQDYDQAQATLEQSRANLLTQQATVKSARTDLDRCTITSPADGVVIYKQAEVGKTVVSSFSAPTLFTIAQDLKRMRIVAPISEVDIGSVKPGQQVTFTVDALPRKTFSGRLTQIRNPYTPTDRQQQQPQEGTGSGIASFDAIIEVDNPDLLLRPSLTAVVSIITDARENVLEVPSGALHVKLPDGVKTDESQLERSRTTGPQPGITVFALPGGNREATPRAIRVTTGISDGISTEILRGLKEGDTLITGIASVFEPEKRSLFKSND